MGELWSVGAPGKLQHEEIWAPIEGFPDYAISSYGRVKNIKLDRLLNPHHNSYGYHRVSLRRDGQTFDKLVHRLVAGAFMGGFHTTYRVRHVNDNANNNVFNLRLERDRGMGQFKKKHPPVRVRRLRVVELDMVFATVLNCARHLKTHPSSIYKVLRGERETHLGYRFELFEEE